MIFNKFLSNLTHILDFDQYPIQIADISEMAVLTNPLVNRYFTIHIKNKLTDIFVTFCPVLDA